MNKTPAQAAAADRAADLLATVPTSDLIAALLLIDAKPELTIDERLAKVWTIEEVERRFDVEAAMNAWADEVSELSYVEALLIALPTEALA